MYQSGAGALFPYGHTMRSHCADEGERMSGTDYQTVISQAISHSPDGGARLDFRNASFAAGDGKFDSTEDLIRHLCRVLYAGPVGAGVGGSVSRTGSYTRRAAGGRDAVTFGDVVLDEITSASGALVLGDRRIDVAALRAAGQPHETPAITPQDAQLVYNGQVNGTQQWVATDGSEIQYRAPGGTLTFHAWTRSYFFGYWSMGASVTADGENYQAGIIDSNYYMTVPEKTGCEIVKSGEATDSNNNYFDEWQWGWNSQQPARVASFCRAQWNGARFSGLVTAGSGCTNYQEYPWPPGYPPNWPPIPTGIQVSPAEIAMSANGVGLTAVGSAVVRNYGSAQNEGQVLASTSNEFSWPSGPFTLPAGGQFPITVTFEGGEAGQYQTTLRMLVGISGSFEVPVIATVVAKGPPK